MVKYKSYTKILLYFLKKLSKRKKNSEANLKLYYFYKLPNSFHKNYLNKPKLTILLFNTIC